MPFVESQYPHFKSLQDPFYSDNSYYEDYDPSFDPNFDEDTIYDGPSPIQVVCILAD